MEKNTMIIIGALIIAGAGVVFTMQSVDAPISTQSATKSIVNAELVIDQRQYDFGTIDINAGTVTTEFSVTNTGEEAIVVKDGTTSCACTVAELGGVGIQMHKSMADSVTIEPGETKIMTVTYDPLFHGPNGTGKITREVILKTNSVTTPEVRARFIADVVKS